MWRGEEGERLKRGKPEDIGWYTQNALGITRDWDDEEISSLGRSMCMGEERERERGREGGEEDEIYRIFEIPVHSACRTRRLHFSRKPSPSLSIYLSVCYVCLSLFSPPPRFLFSAFLFPVSAFPSSPLRFSFSFFLLSLSLDRLRCIRIEKSILESLSITMTRWCMEGLVDL